MHSWKRPNHPEHAQLYMTRSPRVGVLQSVRSMLAGAHSRLLLCVLGLGLVGSRGRRTGYSAFLGAAPDGSDHSMSAFHDLRFSLHDVALFTPAFELATQGFIHGSIGQSAVVEVCELACTDLPKVFG